MKELIGTGVRKDGLYHFSKLDLVQRVSAIGSTSSLELWHRRMGHPSEKVVKLLPHVSNEDFLDKACEICMRAKHHRDNFPLSDTKLLEFLRKYIVI